MGEMGPEPSSDNSFPFNEFVNAFKVGINKLILLLNIYLLLDCWTIGLSKNWGIGNKDVLTGYLIPKQTVKAAETVKLSSELD